MRITTQILTIALLAMVFTPIVSADNTDLQGRAILPWSGLVFEDDGAVVNSPSSFLNGVSNRVRLNVSDGIGDGSLFLDHFVSRSDAGFDRLANAFVGEHMYPGAMVHDAWFGWWLDLDNDGRINDNHDSFSKCSTSNTALGADPCALDEFKWRGIASNENTPVVGWMTPSNYPWSELIDAQTRADSFCYLDPWFDYTFGPEDENATYSEEDFINDNFDCTAPVLGAYNDGSNTAPNVFVDDTDHSNNHQGYSAGHGWESIYIDEGFLVTNYVVVAGNAVKSIGSAGGYKIDGAKTLTDVDRYESMSADVEILYLSAAGASREAVYSSSRTANVTLVETFDSVGPTISEVDSLANDTAGEFIDVIVDAIAPAIDVAIDALDNANNVLRANANPWKEEPYHGTWNTLYTPIAKEPDNFEDVYPHVIKGAASLTGEFNDYSAYLDGWNLFGDVVGEIKIGMVTNANIRPANVETGVSGDVPDVLPILAPISILGYDDGTEIGVHSQFSFTYADPYGAGNDGSGRSPAPILGFAGYAVAWRDLNADTWVGEVCDSEDPNWACDDAYNGGVVSSYDDWSTTLSDGETQGVCGLTTMVNGVITLYPINGNWPDVIVYRWYDRPTRNVWDATDDSQQYRTEVVSDNSPITIRWDPGYFNCAGNGGYYSRGADEVVFPRGTAGMSFKSVSTIVLTNGYDDADLGIEIAPGESFTDVDYYVSGL